MITILSTVVSILGFRLRRRASLELELIALRHQVSVLRRPEEAVDVPTSVATTLPDAITTFTSGNSARTKRARAMPSSIPGLPTSVNRRSTRAPVRSTESTSSLREGAVTPTEPLETPARGDTTVLVAEDDVILRTVVAEQLREEGYSVVEASKCKRTLMARRAALKKD
jgi:CheY-like chemotaxis protein